MMTMMTMMPQKNSYWIIAASTRYALREVVLLSLSIRVPGSGTSDVMLVSSQMVATNDVDALAQHLASPWTH